MTCSQHFSRALIPDMQNFVPRIPPADTVWSSDRTSDHTSKVDIKFDHICIVNALGPSSKTSNWCHDGIEECQFASDGHISAQKNPFVGKEKFDSQTVNGNQRQRQRQPCMPHWAACFRHRGEIVKLHPIYINTCKTPKIQAGLNAKVRHQLQRPPMKVNSSSGKNL